jgi:hypothetical protein
VILGSASTSPLSPDDWLDGTEKVLDIVSPAARHVYLLRPTPVLPFDAPSCLAPRGALFELLSDGRRCEAPSHTATGDAVFRSLTEAARHFPNTTVVDMTDDICPDGRCRGERDGMVVFRDTEHLNADYAGTLKGALARRLGMDKLQD